MDFSKSNNPFPKLGELFFGKVKERISVVVFVCVRNTYAHFAFHFKHAGNVIIEVENVVQTAVVSDSVF